VVTSSTPSLMAGRLRTGRLRSLVSAFGRPARRHDVPHTRARFEADIAGSGRSLNDGRIAMEDRRHEHGTQHGSRGVDVVTLVLQQHVDIVELLEEVAVADPDGRRRLLEEAVCLVGAHEAAEQRVLRPVSEGTAGSDVADQRTREGQRSVSEVQQLAGADPTASSFPARLDRFRRTFAAHALLEEAHELSTIRARLTAAQRCTLGGAFQTEFDAARRVRYADRPTGDGRVAGGMAQRVRRSVTRSASNS